jgi:hypothetical protein
MKIIITEEEKKHIKSLYMNESTRGNNLMFNYVDYLILEGSEKIDNKNRTIWYKDGKEIMQYEKKKNTMYFKYSIWLDIKQFLGIEAGHIRREFLESWLEHHGYHNVHPHVEAFHDDLFER